MKYHYQAGIVEKDKKGHPKAWLSFFIVMIFVVYGGFLAAILSLNGWPLDPVNKTAKIVQTSRPSNNKDILYIPVLNLAAQIGSGGVQKSGNPAKSAVTINGDKLAFGLTPESLRASSPFFNLPDLRDGDEVFLDSGGTRYVYKIEKSDTSKRQMTLKTSGAKLTAKPVGTVVWEGKTPQIQSF